MKITIQGCDYSAALDAIEPLRIERKLNEPAVCQFWLSLPAQGSLPAPLQSQSVAVTGNEGTVYFTGFIACAPLPEFAGWGVEGPAFRFAIQAESDEFLMNRLPAAEMKSASGMTAGELLASLVAHTGSATISAPSQSLEAPISNFCAAPGATWSRNAGSIARQARAAYRAQAGVLQLSEIPAAVHTLNETDGSLNLAGLTFTANLKRGLANDITVCGEHEPVAYVTEYFAGDGSTAQFNLTEAPYFPPAHSSALIDEVFNRPVLDLSVWRKSGPADSLGIGAGGLAMNSGTGADGQTMLMWLDSIEMGGTVLIEATGLVLANGSSGILAGLYAGSDTASGCVAGFQASAQPGGGVVSVRPVILGEPAGMEYSINPAKQYNLRLRLNCPESERSLAIYRCSGEDGVITTGGQASSAPARLLFDIQECVNGVLGMPVTLFDGSINDLPPACSVVAASLIDLRGSMRAFRLANLGTGWVQTTPVGGGPYSRRFGPPADGGECILDRSGRLLFATGFIPQVGERIAVSYRTQGRAVGRVVDSNSQQALANAGLPAVSQWIGSVRNPPPRSSADCRNAAAALVAASAGASAQRSGTYTSASTMLASDVWPGDALHLISSTFGMDSQVIVRTVRLTYASTYPDLVLYEIKFADDWAQDLAIDTSDAVPPDVWLPAAVAPTVLPNLGNVSVTAFGESTITIHIGTAPPDGGGFEIRRRDFAFMAGEDPDLVMRGSQQNLTFSRERAGDRFYIRMFDGATPPNYSEFSTALIINLPVDSDL